MKGYEILELLITSSVLILGITALRVLAGDRLSGRVRYALWLAVALRLLLPFLLLAVPSLEKGLQNGYGMMRVLGMERRGDADPAASGRFPSEVPGVPGVGAQNGGSSVGGSQIWTEEPAGAKDQTAGLRQTGTAEPRTVVEETSEEPGGASSMDWPTVLTGVWAGGAVLLALWELFVNLDFYRRLKRNRKPFAQETVPLKVYVTPAVRVPCQYGRGIYLPKRLETEGAGLRHVLIHEYCHYRQGDFLWSLLRCVLLAVYWMNPFVWLAAVLSKKDCELACDEAALKRLRRSERLDYGKTLVRLASGKEERGGVFRAATSLAGSWGTVKERIWRVALGKKRFSGVVTVCTALLGIVLLAGCSFTEKGEASSLTLKIAETEEAELWFNDDFESEDYGEMAVLAADGKYYGLGRLEPLEEKAKEGAEGDEPFAALGGKIVPDDYDGDGAEELAVTVWHYAEAGKDCRKQERLFVLEPDGGGWKVHEYTEEDYRQDWEKFLKSTGMDDDVDFVDYEEDLGDFSERKFALEPGEILSRTYLRSLYGEKWVMGALNYRGAGKFLFDGAHYQKTRMDLEELRVPKEDVVLDEDVFMVPEGAGAVGYEAAEEDVALPEEELWWFGKGERSYSTMLAETNGQELWYNDEAGPENYGELAVLAGDGNYYVLGRLEEPEETDIRDLSVSVSGEMRLADYDGDGTKELAVAVRRRAGDGKKSYSDITRLFVLEKMGEGWHPYEYRPEAYVEDWKALLPPEIRDEDNIRYDKAVGIYLQGDAISFHSYSASWDGEYGYTFPDGGIMSRLDVRVEYRDAGGFSLSGPYAQEGMEGALEEYRALMEQ